MTFRVKVVEDWSFDECLSQFDNSFPSSGCEKARLRLGLRRLFGLRRFSTFLPNLINFNLTAINLNVVYPTSINSVTSSSTVTTNPDYGCVEGSVLLEVFNIEVSSAAIRLNPWINRR